MSVSPAQTDSTVTAGGQSQSVSEPRQGSSKYLQWMRLCIEGIFHEVYRMVRVHEKVEILEGLAGKKRFHVIFGLAIWVLLLQ